MVKRDEALEKAVGRAREVAKEDLEEERRVGKVAATPQLLIAVDAIAPPLPHNKCKLPQYQSCGSREPVMEYIVSI